MSRNEDDGAPAPNLTAGSGARRSTARRITEQRFLGVGVCPGIAIGQAFGSKEPQAVITRHRIQAADITSELNRLEAGIVQSLRQLAKLKHKLSVLPDEARSEIEPLIDAYAHMLGPTRLTKGMRQRIRQALVSAETAVVDECEATAGLLESAGLALNEDDKASQERRAEEVREIGRRLVRNLTRTGFRSFSDLPDGAILVSETLRPADAALLKPDRVAGVVTDDGGADGHTAIMLRSLGLPSVLGVPGLSQRIMAGDTVIIDGTAGLVILNPTADTLAQARSEQLSFAHERQRLAGLRRLPAQTLDGCTIALQVNIELLAELPIARQVGAQGVGLLRTEFLFMNRETLPDEQVQEQIYRTVIQSAEGQPVTIRVLDWGGEKEIEALSNAGLVPELDDTNPALGLRGIRLLLRRPGLLETQLSAILHAANAGPTRVLLPMVTCVEEVRQAREIYDRVVRRLRRERRALPDLLPPIGIMIETPGAALAADALAQEADFFAIGTNDLTMYTLAVDRAESSLDSLYDPLHPAVLRLIQFSISAGARLGRQVSICGEIAGSSDFAPLLIGLGVRQLSMNASNLPRVKQAIRSVGLAGCEKLAADVMSQCEAQTTRELIAAFNGAITPRPL